MAKNNYYHVATCVPACKVFSMMSIFFYHHLTVSLALLYPEYLYPPFFYPLPIFPLPLLHLLPLLLPISNHFSLFLSFSLSLPSFSSTYPSPPLFSPFFYPPYIFPVFSLLLVLFFSVIFSLIRTFLLFEKCSMNHGHLPFNCR